MEQMTMEEQVIRLTAMLNSCVQQRDSATNGSLNLSAELAMKDSQITLLRQEVEQLKKKTELPTMDAVGKKKKE